MLSIFDLLLINGADTYTGPIWAAQSTIASAAGADSVNANYPTGISANHLLLLFVIIDSGGGETISSYPVIAGWTSIGATATGIRRGGALYRKIATGSESGTLTVTASTSAGTGTVTAFINRYTGNQTGTPVENGAVTSGSSTTPSPSSLASGAAQELAVCFFGYFNSATISAITGQTGGTWVESAAEQTASGAFSMDAQHAQLVSATTISGGSATLSSTALWISIVCAIKP